MSTAQPPPPKQPRKRPYPRDYLDNEDIRCVASPYDPSYSGVVTPVLSSEMKLLILDRLEKEIMSKMRGCICRTTRRTGSSRGNTKRAGGKRKRKSSLRDWDEHNDNVRGDQKVEGTTKATSSIEIRDNVDDRVESSCSDEMDEGVPASLSSSLKVSRDQQLNMSIAESVVKSRFIVGVNNCTRILERHCNNLRQRCTISSSKIVPKKTTSPKSKSSNISPLPMLILLARDVRPATIIAHIPIYSQILNIPSLILPGKASVELGKAVGIKSVSVAVFLPACESGNFSPSVGMDKNETSKFDREWKRHNDDIDSFVQFVLSKIPL